MHPEVKKIQTQRKKRFYKYTKKDKPRSAFSTYKEENNLPELSYREWRKLSGNPIKSYPKKPAKNKSIIKIEVEDPVITLGQELDEINERLASCKIADIEELVRQRSILITKIENHGSQSTKGNKKQKQVA